MAMIYKTKQIWRCPKSRIEITLGDASFDILLPFNKIPQQDGELFFKSQHSAQFKG